MVVKVEKWDGKREYSFDEKEMELMRDTSAKLMGYFDGVEGHELAKYWMNILFCMLRNIDTDKTDDGDI
jgi:hypothetical protein